MLKNMCKTIKYHGRIEVCLNDDDDDDGGDGGGGGGDGDIYTKFI